MSTSIPSQPQGFQFPGTFELSVMGAADAGLERLLLSVLTELGFTVDVGHVALSGTCRACRERAGEEKP